MQKSNNLKDSLPVILVFIIIFVFGLLLVFSTAKTNYDIIRGLILLLLSFLIPVVCALYVYVGLNRDKGEKDSFFKRPLDINEVSKLLPNIDKDKFLTDRYNDFLTIQKAFMNFDNPKLREMVTDELYNIYKMNMLALNFLKKENIYKKIKHEYSEIVQIKEVKGMQCVEIELFVSYINYSKRNNRIVRGLLFRHFIEHYSIKFIKKDDSIDRCPNCGSKLSDSASQKCEFCHSIIDRVGGKWVLSEIYSISKYLYSKKVLNTKKD